MDQATKDATVKDLEEAIGRVNGMKPAGSRSYVNDRLRRVRDRVAAEQATSGPAPGPPPGPTPTPTPPASGFGTFSNTKQPPAAWRYFGGESAFNQPVDKSKIHPKSAAKISWLAGFGTLPANLDIGDSATGPGSAHAICWSTPSDPEYTIRQGSGYRDWFAAMEGRRVRIPVKARAGQDGFDYQLAVIDQAAGLMVDFWQFEHPDGGGERRRSPAGGDVYCTGAAMATIGDNRGTGIEYNGSSTQGCFALPAGQIRGEEMLAGKIDHALFAVVPASARSGYFVPPCPNPKTTPGGTDKIDVGQRLFLDMSDAEIDGRPIKPWEKIIAKAIARYGIIVGDGGGSSQVMFSMQALSGYTYAPFGISDPWVAYARQFVAPYTDGSGGVHYVLRPTSGGIDWRGRMRVCAA